MPRLTLFKDRLNLVKELKSAVDGERMFQTGVTPVSSSFLKPAQKCQVVAKEFDTAGPACEKVRSLNLQFAAVGSSIRTAGFFPTRSGFSGLVWVSGYFYGKFGVTYLLMEAVMNDVVMTLPSLCDLGDMISR